MQLPEAYNRYETLSLQMGKNALVVVEKVEKEGGVLEMRIGGMSEDEMAKEMWR